MKVTRLTERREKFFTRMKKQTDKKRIFIFAFCLLPFAFLSSACREDMQNQPNTGRTGKAHFSRTERQGGRQLKALWRAGHLKDDALFYTGKTTGPATDATSEFQGFTSSFPREVTEETLKRGEERYNIYCSVCHDRSGYGEGMVVQRGYKRPPTFHSDRLRQAPVGYLFDVITNGFGAMPDYASQIPPKDRWAIVAYLRALQLSQNTNINALSAEERKKLESGEGNQEQKTEKGEQHQ
jgi:mono/diheme cytochrome c family protein